MHLTPDRILLRPDQSLDQRTFDQSGHEVGIDDQSHDQIWSDLLALGHVFQKNIADALLGESRQPRRGEILVTRSERTQETRAVSYRAHRHERPKTVLPIQEARMVVPVETERRSIQTAYHDKHTRAFWATGSEHIDRGTHLRKLALGGNLPETNRKLAHREAALARLEVMEQKRNERRRNEAPSDDIQF